MVTGIFNDHRRATWNRVGVAVALAAMLLAGACSKASDKPLEGASSKDTVAAAGGSLFRQYCQTCHGPQASGSNFGPPLVHASYKPNHHPDAAFYRAAQSGARAHHWKFGNMPPVAGIRTEEITQIIAYIRGLQREAGIY